MPEAPRLLAAQARLRARQHELVLGESPEDRARPARRARPTEQALDAGSPERPPEDARGAQDPPLLARQGLEAGLHHGPGRARGAGWLAARCRPDELLQKQRVALAARDDAADEIVRGLAPQHGAHEVLARALGQRTQVDRRGRRGAPPQVGVALPQARTRQRQDEEGAVGEPSERVSHEAHARGVRPVQIVEHQNVRSGLALRAEPGLEGLLDASALQDGLGAGGLQVGASLVCEGDAGELTEPLGDTEGAIGGQRAGDPRDDAIALRAGGIRGADPARAAHDGGHQAEGLLGAQRLRAAEKELRARQDAVDELPAQPRLAAPRGARDQHDARALLGDALLEDAEGTEELLLASDEGRALAEDRTARIEHLALEAQDVSQRILAELEAAVEELRGELVDADVLDLLRERHRPVDHLAARALGPDLSSTGRQRHRPAPELLAEREREPCRGRDEVGRDGATHRADDRAVDEAVHATTEQQRLRLQLAQELVGLRGRREPNRVRLRVAGKHQSRQHHGLQPELAVRDGAPGRRGIRRRERAACVLEPFEHLLGGPRAAIAALGHERLDQLDHRRGNEGRERSQRRGIPDQHPQQDRDGVRRIERRLSGQALVQDRAEREEVGAPVHLIPASHLLGRHVAGRPEHDTGARHLPVDVLPARETEVDEHDVFDPAARQEEVAGLDVAVDEAVAVRGGQRLRDALAQRQALVDVERSPREPLREVLALEPLHREPQPPLRRGAVAEVADDRRVLEGRQDLGLADEPLEVVRARQLEELQGDRLAGVAIGREVHGRRPAPPDAVLEAIPAGHGPPAFPVRLQPVDCT